MNNRKSDLRSWQRILCGALGVEQVSGSRSDRQQSSAGKTFRRLLRRLGFSVSGRGLSLAHQWLAEHFILAQPTQKGLPSCAR